MQMARFLALLAPLLGMAIATPGCHESEAEPADMAQRPPDLLPPPPDMLLPNRAPTDHPPALQLTHFGGPTIAAMEPYTIVWQGEDTLGQKLHTFISFLVQSDYWIHVVGEYGAMKGTPKSLIVLDEQPPATLDDSQMDGIVAGLVASGKVPEVTDNTVLFFIVPESTTSTMFGARGCWEYGGYHAETQQLISGRHIPYAVNLQCAGSAVASQTAMDSLTTTVSHEATEAQTDPHPFFAPGWITDDSALGGEVADLCIYNDTTISGPEGEYAVTGVYSQKAAIAGDVEPCQPSPPGMPYFNVAVSPINVEVFTDDSGLGAADAEYQPFAYGDVGLIKWSIVQPPGQGIKITPTSGEGHAGETIRVKIRTTSNARAGKYPLILGVRSDKGRTSYGATITIY
jgi:hypothetical protein